MANILVTYEVLDNTADVNIVSLSDMFTCMGVPYKFTRTSQVKSNDLVWGDVILAIRPNSIYSLQIATAAKQSGRYYILLIDDDIINLDVSHPDYWKRKYTISCLELGDALLTPNLFIQKDYCSRFHLKPILVNAHVNEEDIKPIHHINHIIKFIYPAGKDHAEIFNKYLSPVFNRIIEKYKDVIDITFIGVRPNLAQFENVHYIEQMAYSDYLKFMQKEQFDVGLAPLEDTSFCRRKYFVKYIEYSKYGILGMYSDSYPYKFVVRNKENGILVKNSIEEWMKEITRLIECPLEIKRMIEVARQDLRENFTIDKVTQAFIFQCPEIIEFKAQTSSVQYVSSLFSVINFKIKNILSKIICRLTPKGKKYLSIIFKS